MRRWERIQLAWPGAEVPDGWRAWLRDRAGPSEPVRVELAANVLDTPTAELAAAGLVARASSWAAVRTIEIAAIPIDPEITLDDGISIALAPRDDPATVLPQLLARTLSIRVTERPRSIFELHVARERWPIRLEDFEAELCIDRVDVRVSGVSIGILGELVLEKIHGPSASFAALGHALAELPLLEPAAATIVERARALVGLPAVQWPGKPPEPEPDAELGDAARQLWASMWASALAHEQGVRAGLDPEQVHKMRVALRRLRTALRVFAGAFEGAPAGEWRDELRWLGRLLGDVRDLDVHRLALPHWQARFSEAPADGWGELDRRLVARRMVAHAKLVEALDGPRRHALDRLAQACLCAPARSSTSVADAMPRLVSKQVRRCRSAYSRLRERGTVELAHRLRIRIKNLRYTLEFLRATEPVRFPVHARALAEAQDQLGQLQDAVQTGRLARELALAEPEQSIVRQALGALVGFGAASEQAARSIAMETVEAADLDARLHDLDLDD